MAIGSKIKQARLEAGLSQRQLCGNTITRNMLSQIENGTARPSMDTLQFLAKQLGKPISFFLEETAVLSPNPQIMADARKAFSERKFATVLTVLGDYQAPDTLFDEEQQYLWALAALAQGELLLSGNDGASAVALLEQIRRDCIYYRPDMEQKRRALLRQGYQLLETYFQRQEDYKQAYFYACKLRDMS